jgi:hypothetical protein
VLARSPALTAQIYSHLEVDDLRDAIERIESTGAAQVARAAARA